MKGNANTEEPIRPIIIPELCIACGACVEVCPYHALSLIGGVPVLDTSIVCQYCGNCEEVCPTEAIRRSFLVVFSPPAA